MKVLLETVPKAYEPALGKEIKEVSDGRYVARMARTPADLEAVLRLRYEVFYTELGRGDAPAGGLDLDEYDLRCDHILVTERATGRVVGTYRLNTIEGAGDASGFYAHGEFSIEDLPPRVIKRAVELGRACIARDHRNTRVLFLLWRVLARFLEKNRKRYLFGCCSIFTQDGVTAARILRRLERDGRVHETISVSPRPEKACLPADPVPADETEEIELPALVNIYLRIGAKICGEPAIDREFGTIDYFVLFDLAGISRKYKRMFFG